MSRGFTTLSSYPISQTQIKNNKPKKHRAAMSSSSLGCYLGGLSTPRKPSSPSLSCRALPITHSQSQSQSQPPPSNISTNSIHLQTSSTHPLISRRQVFGITVISGSLLDALLVQPEAAPAADSGVCEFTVAPSGLAFCDQRLGVGPQPSKGQLIKVPHLMKYVFRNFHLTSTNLSNLIRFVRNPIHIE